MTHARRALKILYPRKGTLPQKALLLIPLSLFSMKTELEHAALLSDAFPSHLQWSMYV